MLNESALVLEGVTLAQVVELVVKVLVDLASSTVADEQATENTHAAHPENLAILYDIPSVKEFHHGTSHHDIDPIGHRPANRHSSRPPRESRINCIPGHTGLLGTLTLTQTAVSADSAGGVELTGTDAGVHGDGLADDEAIADELTDGLAGVGVGDLIHLIGVEPNLALAAAHHGGGEALLGAKVDPVDEKPSVSMKPKSIEQIVFPESQRGRIGGRNQGM